LTPDGEGVDNVIEVGGPLTIAQSLEATKFDGLISIIGFLSGGAEKCPSFTEVLSRNVLARGVLVGSRLQFEEMVRGPFGKFVQGGKYHSQLQNRAIEASKIKPVVDKKIFKLNELKEHAHP
jgi:NADPH:quinone reductase-like Zn-dependent oxidoreductase